MALTKIDELRRDGDLRGESYAGKDFTASLTKYSVRVRNGGGAYADIPKEEFNYVLDGIRRWKERDTRWDSEVLRGGRLELILHSKSLGIRSNDQPVFFDPKQVELVLDALFLASAREQLYGH